MSNYNHGSTKNLSEHGYVVKILVIVLFREDLSGKVSLNYTCSLVNFNELADWTLSGEIEDYKNFYEPVTFSLAENYLDEVANDQRGDADESSSASDCGEDLTGSEMDTGDSDIIIKQEDAKSLTRCVFVDRLDGCIKRCENSKSCGNFARYGKWMEMVFLKQVAYLNGWVFVVVILF